MSVTYCYPKIGRAGLGNCMLPWARAVVAGHKRSCRILAPQWCQPRMGAIIRGEKMTRFYLGDFSNKGYVRGINRWFVLRSGEWIREDDARQTTTAWHEGKGRPYIIVFEGLRNYFHDIWYDHLVVREELFQIVAPWVLDKLAAVKVPFIAMHVRRGDIVQPGLTQTELLAKAHYTPLEWFISAAKAVRQDEYWGEFPIFVVSDGREEELGELLSVPKCKLVSLGSAIGDILLLSKARLMFGSGHSTFSMWGSYVGRVPTLYCPGKMDQNVFPPEAGIKELEWASGVALPRL